MEEYQNTAQENPNTPRLDQPIGVDIEWYISGNISKKTLRSIYYNKKVDDEILGVFGFEYNKILVLSNFCIKELDRGFFRTNYKFKEMKYEDLTEIQRQLNCLYIVLTNQFMPNNPPSKYCLQTEEATEIAIEILLEKSTLDNITVLPSIEEMKQKQREEKQQRAEEKCQQRIEKRQQQWEERQRRKRYARSIDERRVNTLKKPNPMLCSACGSNNPNNSNFCITCGVSLK